MPTPTPRPTTAQLRLRMLRAERRFSRTLNRSGIVRHKKTGECYVATQLSFRENDLAIDVVYYHLPAEADAEQFAPHMYFHRPLPEFLEKFEHCPESGELPPAARQTVKAVEAFKLGKL